MIYNLNVIPNRRSAATIHLLLFMLWPFASFLLSLANFRNKTSRIYYILFGGLYGYSQYFGETGDSGRLWQQFANMANSSLAELWTQAFDITQSPDVYKSLLFGVFSRFTDNGNIMFFVVALIYTAFFVGIINWILKYIPRKINTLSVLLLIAIALSFPFSIIGGIRSGTAGMMLLFCIFSYLFTEEKKYLFLMAFTPLIHFSYFGFLFFAYVAILFRERPVAIYLMFIISFLLRAFDLNQIVSDYFGGSAIERKSTVYTNEEINEAGRQSINNMNWYARYYLDIMRYFLLIALPLVWFKIRERASGVTRSVFLFFLSFYSLYNISSSALHMAIRVLPLLNFCGLTFFLFGYNEAYSKFIKNLIIIGFPVILLFILVSFRVGQHTINPHLFYGNLFSILFFPGNI